MDDGPSLQQFIAALLPAEKQAFASLSGTSVNYLYQLQIGHRRPGLRLAQQFVDASVAMFAGDPARQLTLDRIYRHYLARIACTTSEQR